MFSRDEGATTAVSFSFPTEYLLEHGPAHLRALALELARELPFSFGYASLAFVSHQGSCFSALELFGFLERYPGFDLYHLGDTSHIIGTRARGAYWLTFLGQPMLDQQLGGTEALHQVLSFPEVSFQPLEGERLLVTLGEWPEAIDTTKEHYLPQYLALANLLEPFLYEPRANRFRLDRDNLRRWIRHLTRPTGP